MVKRAPLVVSGTIAGIVGVLSFHTRPATSSLGAGALAGASKGGSPGSTSSPGNATSGGPSGTPAVSPSSQAPTAPRGPAGRSAPTTTSPASNAAPTSATGPVVNYFYGMLSVRVDVSGRKITNISIASLQDGGNPLSQQIDQYALPQLRQQALAANSTNIQGVSGATYTSQGFAQSLQGALKKAGL